MKQRLEGCEEGPSSASEAEAEDEEKVEEGNEKPSQEERKKAAIAEKKQAEIMKAEFVFYDSRSLLIFNLISVGL